MNARTARKVWLSRCLLTALLVPVTSAVSVVATGVPAVAYATEDIATTAEAANGTNGGQCKAFVNGVVSAITGVSPSGYQQGFANAGATEVTDPANAVKGDIIQITPAGSDDKTAVSMYNFSDPSKRLHTTIIRAPRNTDGTFKVVDSNWGFDEMVTEHVFNSYAWAAGSIVKIWRFGNSGGVSSTRPTGGGSASTRGTARLDLFAQGTNTTGPNTYHKWEDAGPWSSWVSLENANVRITSAVASVSWSSDRIDLFARGTSGNLLHKWWGASTGWVNDWVSNGGCIIGAPTVTSWSANRLDVFAQGCNATGSNLVHNWWDGAHWWWEAVYESAGVRITSSPSATAWAQGRIDVFARGTAGDLLHKWYDGTSWSDWHSEGGGIIGAPVVASWASCRLDVFVVGTNTGNNLWHKWYDGMNWYWELTPGTDNVQIDNVLGAVSWGSGRIDILVIGPGNEPLHKWYDAGGLGWYNYEHLGGTVLA